MYSYITEELPKTVFKAFDQIDSSRVSITGHSMGGHGALSLYLKNPGMYKSVSAYAPITNPLKAPWGEKAFKGYFGDDWQSKGAEHDSTELLKKWKGGDLDILIDVVCLTSESGHAHADNGRALATISTRMDSYYQKTSSQLPRKSDKRKVSMSGISLTTITATSRWLVSLMTTWIMRRNIFLPSMSPHAKSSLPFTKNLPSSGHPARGVRVFPRNV